MMTRLMWSTHRLLLDTAQRATYTTHLTGDLAVMPGIHDADEECQYRVVLW